MHIAFLNPQGNFDSKDSYWAEHPDFGGQLVYVKEVASELSKLGHRVDILTRQIVDPEWPQFSEPLDAYPGLPNLRILRIACGPQKFLNKEELWPFLATEWVPGIMAFYHQEGNFPDMFTAHYGDGGLAGAVLLRDLGVPFTFTAHSLGAQKLDKLIGAGSGLEDLERRYHFSARIAAERAAISYASRLISSTQQERDMQYRHPAYKSAVANRSAEAFSIIPPGVNVRVFSSDPGACDGEIAERIQIFGLQQLAPERLKLPYVVSASRFEPKKNVTGLVRAFLGDPDLLASANLLLTVRAPVVGFSQAAFFDSADNPTLDEIRELLNDPRIKGKVLLFPANGQAELAAVYRAISSRGSVFVLPALYEPFGLAPLEAMACGLPVVVTKNGGPQESMLEDGKEFGVLVDPQQPQAIADGIKRLLGSRSEWLRFQKAGMQRVLQKFTWKQTALGYQTVMQEIAAAPLRERLDSEIDLPEFFFDRSSATEYHPGVLDWLVK